MKLMWDYGVAGQAAARLDEISSEIDDLESSRSLLLKRIEKACEQLRQAGRRASRARASVDFIRDNAAISDSIELQLIEDELARLDEAISEVSDETLGMLFEAESLEESITEAEDEVEQLLAVLTEGRTRQPRGH